MAIDPSISLGVRVPTINLDVPSPIAQMGQMMTLRGLMEQQQARQMQMEQTRLENAALERKAAQQEKIAQLFAGGTRPTEEQLLAVGGPEAATAIKNLHDADKARFDGMEAFQKGITSRAQGILSMRPEARPVAWTLERQALVRAAPQLADQLPVEYPGDDYLSGQVQRGLSSLQYFQNIRETAKAALEKPKLQAEGLQAQLGLAAQTVPNNQADWDVWREGLSPDLQKRVPAMYSPAAEQLVRYSGMTAQQRAADIRAGETAKETGRHNLATEAGAEQTRKETARHDRALEARVAQATAAGLTQSQSQRVLQIAGQFDNEPMVKNYNVIAEANNFVRSLGEKGGGNAGDDQALLYAFAKAMDPGSVVREGEYATVQRYAQSWADTFGFKAARIFSNSPFLSDDARKQMKATIEKKATSAKTSYDNIYNEYGRRIERQSGVQSGKDYLTNYGQAFEAPAAPAAAPKAPGAALKINTKEEYDKLPSGATYVDAQDGKTYTKR